VCVCVCVCARARALLFGGGAELLYVEQNVFLKSHVTKTVKRKEEYEKIQQLLFKICLNAHGNN